MDIGAPGTSGFFALYDGDGDMPGTRISRAAALTAVAGPGARPLVEFSVTGGGASVIWDAGFPALPRMQFFNDDGSSLEVWFTYDSWFWGEGSGDISDVTPFLLELEGAHEDFVPEEQIGSGWAVTAYTSSDGGQSVSVHAAIGHQLGDRIQKVRVWRAPADPEPAVFWTSRMGCTESIP